MLPKKEMSNPDTFVVKHTRAYSWLSRWQHLFGHDFYLSQRMAEVVYKYPIILDAVASEMQRKGDSMMAK